MLKGVIKKSTGSWYDILDEQGNTIQARIKGKFRLEGKKVTNPVAVGDEVVFSMEDRGDNAVIEELLPRKNYIIRKANNLSKQEHIIAANLDQVLIIATLAYPRTSQGFIDRVLVNAEAYEIPAGIIFNKTDIYMSEGLEYVQEMKELYESLCYMCEGVSVKTGQNMDFLKAYLQGKTTLLTGHSGVGKSSMLNSLFPDLGLKTGIISNFSQKGKHTTTFAEMHVLDEHTRLIDTPGIKEFGIVDMDKEEVSHFFPEMRHFLGHCRFNNCLHVNEPGCAVLDALEKGEIAPSRYNSYLSILGGEDTFR